MGVKSPWGNKATKQTKCGDQWELENHWENQKKQNVETNGGEKPLGNHKNIFSIKNVETNGG